MLSRRIIVVYSANPNDILLAAYGYLRRVGSNFGCHCILKGENGKSEQINRIWYSLALSHFNIYSASVTEHNETAMSWE